MSPRNLREIDDLRRQIWEEPREVLVRHLILYLVFLAVLPFGLYALVQKAVESRAGSYEKLSVRTVGPKLTHGGAD